MSVKAGLVDQNFSLLSLETKKIITKISDEIKKIDLQFIGDSGAGRVNLADQKLDIEGTADQVVTSASDQKLTISLAESISITGSFSCGPTLTISDSATTSPLNITERSAEPSNPVSGDIYLDDGTNTGSGNPGWRRYTGAAWEDITAASGYSGLTIGDSISSGAANRILFEDGSNLLAEAAGLTFDGTDFSIPNGSAYQINGSDVLNVDGTECLNVGVGAGVGASGDGSTYIGNECGAGSGTYNTCVGADAGMAMTTANGCSLFGFGAGKRITTGSRNTLLGFGAGQFITSGERDCLFGHSSGSSISTGSYISLFGVDCGAAVTTADYVTGYGYSCINDLTTSAQVTAMGVYSLQRITSAGRDCSAFGYASGGNCTGPYNSFFGSLVAGALQYGEYNSYAGYRAGYGGGGFYSSDSNTAFGSYSLYTSGTNVDNCIGLGFAAGYWNTTTNRFFIDSIHRSDAADELIKSPIWGVIAAASADQEVTINANTTIRHALYLVPDEITATDAGVAASLTTVNTEVTTNGDSDLDNVTLANGTSGQVKHIYCVAVGNAADSFKITPANMVGGTQITFAANPLGLGCTLVYADNEGWVVVANNGGVIS